MKRLLLHAVLVASSLCLPPVGARGEEAASKPSAPHAEFFEKQVKPLLEAHCYKCHGGEAKVKGGLTLTSRAGLIKGGDVGPAFDEKAPEKSLLLAMISYKDDDHQMPPKGKLTAEQIEVLTKWVKMGAPYAGGPVKPPPAGHEEKPDFEKLKDWWAYKKVVRPAAPPVKDAAWVTNPIDAFILARLEAANLKPAPKADKKTLIRRASYDLTGLPPTPAEVDAFVADTSPQAYEKLIDKLLASPQYGEKWGRHWLDLVRYAETNGYERDGPKPFAWRYRDYVIRSFNADKPYDRFIMEQLAGDEIDPTNADAITATGFYRLGLWDDEPADRPLARFDGLDDMLATTWQVMLATTMNCARCHTHKADPLEHRDYYRGLAFLSDIRHYDNGNGSLTDIASAEVRATYEAELKQRDARKEQIGAAMKKLEDAAIAKMPREEQVAAAANDRPAVLQRRLKEFLSDAQWKEHQALKKELADLSGKKVDMKRELALSVGKADVNPPDMFVLARGNPAAPTEKVTPGFPAVFGTPDPVLPKPKPGAPSSGRRTLLAQWIASPDNPLTARVIANRLWQHHFGRGIVRTSSDFGRLGVLPTHPQLLDWLASETVARGWKLKAMHKLIMMSSAYQMSSQDDPAALSRDGNNDLFWRFDMRRLTAEEIRDSMLAINGTLNPKMFGPSIYTEVPAGVLQTSSQPNNAWGKSPPQEQARRSVYIYIKRSLVEPVLNTFDLADTDSSCAVRFTTTVPTQSLTTLNSVYFNKQSSQLAERLRKEAGAKIDDQIRLGLRLVTLRQPTAKEIERCLTLWKELQEKDGIAAEKAMDYVCLMMLNLNEFVYLD